MSGTSKMLERKRQLKDPGGRKSVGSWVSRHANQSASGKANGKQEAAWKQDSLEGLEKGSRVWYKAGPDSWVLGTLGNQQAGAWNVALDSEAGEATGQVRFMYSRKV
jgi:hypothetical protein